jgi:hypothetical protein
VDSTHCNVCFYLHVHSLSHKNTRSFLPFRIYLYISVLSNSHAWGREKGFHTILVHAVCDRRGEVERKRRSDARTGGGGGGGTGKVVPPIKKQRTTTITTTTTTTTVPPNVDTAICIPTNTDISTFPEGILMDDTGTSHGGVDIDDPIMLPLPDELTTTTTTTSRTHQNDTIATDDNSKHPHDTVYDMTPV